MGDKAILAILGVGVLALALGIARCQSHHDSLEDYRRQEDNARWASEPAKLRPDPLPEPPADAALQNTPYIPESLLHRDAPAEPDIAAIKAKFRRGERLSPAEIHAWAAAYPGVAPSADHKSYQELLDENEQLKSKVDDLQKKVDQSDDGDD